MIFTVVLLMKISGSLLLVKSGSNFEALQFLRRFPYSVVQLSYTYRIFSVCEKFFAQLSYENHTIFFHRDDIIVKYNKRNELNELNFNYNEMSCYYVKNITL